MTNVCVDVQLSIAKLTLFLDSNCFLIESTVSNCYPRQMLLSVLADECNNSIRNGLYDRCSSGFHIAIHGILAETNINMG
jgi:hypothetical protein